MVLGIGIGVGFYPEAVFGGGTGPVTPFYYLRPGGGTFYYRRPDGISRYIRP